MPDKAPKQENVPEVKTEIVTLRDTSRSKSTIDLKSAFNISSKQEEKVEVEKPPDTSVDRPIEISKLTQAWLEFAELRKHQIAEYSLLKKEFTLDGVIITIMLANPIEEPLLQNIRVQLTAHLRGRLNNNSLTIVSIMQESEGKKIAYTDKEKFNLLAEKNPALRELKEIFGLDTDY